MNLEDVDSPFVKVCPDCGAEFIPTVETCYDCGAALESRAAETLAGEDRAALQPPTDGCPTEEWVAVQTADLDWARDLAALLTERGIPSRLVQDCASCSPRLGVFVAPADLAAAAGIARALYVERMPDLEDGAALDLPAGRCPACGAGFADGAVECPDCGLAFLPPEAGTG